MIGIRESKEYSQLMFPRSKFFESNMYLYLDDRKSDPIYLLHNLFGVHDPIILKGINDFSTASQELLFLIAPFREENLERKKQNMMKFHASLFQN